ncbi:MAG: PAS domain-containing sensor histidine kinase, partial [Deltaproteobacteria bacterium]|nr:PAS domain-containing sensor histidine kinase [Deltaproteobacteria bacterium]
IGVVRKRVILEVNRLVCEMTGYSRDELIGSNARIFYPDQEEFEVVGRGKYHQIAESGTGTVETRWQRKDGSILDVLLSSTPIEAGNLSGRVTFTALDITERKQAEKALKESELRFRHLFEQVPTLAVQGYDMDGVATYWNSASEKLYGYSSEEAVGRYLLDLIIPDEMRSMVRVDMKAMADTGISIPSSELILKRKDGSRVTVYSSHAIVKKIDGHPELFCIDIDLTELKRIEQNLLLAKEQAEAASRAKSEFLANMSHEIRTPINGIMGMMQLLQLTDLEPDQAQYVDMAINSSNRLTRLLTDILDLSRIEAGKMEFFDAEFVIRDLADSVSDLFTVTARDKGVTLKYILDPAIPARLVGDEARVRQILFNLVGNGLKFTGQGHVGLEMSLLAAKDQDDRCRVLFSVSDTGIGIPEDKLKTLFEPFVQVATSYTRSYQGAGLGLAIVKRLVDLMGGTVAIDSRVGLGTRVDVILPFDLPVGTALTEAGAGSRKAGAPLRILLAEDDPSNALPIRKLLENAGHITAVAENGKRALDLLAAQDFDVVLMDVQMPVMNGVEATQAIRTSPELGSKRNIPIIALTAYAMLGDREKFLEAGMDDHLAKPVRIEDLEKVLERVREGDFGSGADAGSMERP